MSSELEHKADTGVCSMCLERVTQYIMIATAPAIPELKIDVETQENEVCLRCIPAGLKQAIKWGATITLTPLDRWVADAKLIAIEQHKQNEINQAQMRAEWEKVHADIHPDHAKEPVAH